jgi:pilus assembly protein CpaD
MRRFTVLTLIAASASLSACGTSGTTSTMNRGLESIHQPVVSRTDYVFDVSAPESDRLSNADSGRLAAWFDSLQLSFGDRVSVDAPGDYGNARNAVADIVARYGLLVDYQAPLTQGELAPGMVRVVISRTKATVPHCPDFSRASSPEFHGSLASNYGCAINSNLAAMVADPQDLIHGRNASSTADAQRGSRAIRTLQTTPQTGAGGLKVEDTKGK